MDNKVFLAFQQKLKDDKKWDRIKGRAPEAYFEELLDEYGFGYLKPTEKIDLRIELENISFFKENQEDNRMNERAHLLRKYVDELKQQNALLSSKKNHKFAG